MREQERWLRGHRILARLLLGLLLLGLLSSGCEPQPPATDTAAFTRTPGTELTYPYANANPDYRLSFPRDHGPHPTYRIEWWYITANLTGADGTPYALQWTQFRSALPHPTSEGSQALQQYYLAHSAIATGQQLWAAEKYGRTELGTAGVEQAPFTAFIDHWQARSEQADTLFPLQLHFSQGDFGAELRLTNHGPLMLQGEAGYSRKSVDQSNASHYYSMPWLQVSGSLQLDGNNTPVSGQAWLDREWTSALLAADQQGWDWLALHLDDGSALMLYQLRSRSGAPFRFAKWMAHSGESRTFSAAQIEMDPLAFTRLAGRQIPTQWRIGLPEMGLDIRVTPLNPAVYLPLSQPYWEGAVFVTGSHSGRGFLEMTGY